MNEVWKDVIGFEGLYMVSSMGNVKSLNYHRQRIEKLLVAKVSSTGYCQYDLCKDKAVKQIAGHRLVAGAFLQNPESKKTVNHINGVKTDNRVENLEWATAKENSAHAYLTGLKVGAKGEKSVHSKLTDQQVVEIRAKAGTAKIKDIGAEYGVCISLVSQVINRKRWKHI